MIWLYGPTYVIIQHSTMFVFLCPFFFFFQGIKRTRWCLSKRCNITLDSCPINFKVGVTYVLFVVLLGVKKSLGSLVHSRTQCFLPPRHSIYTQMLTCIHSHPYPYLYAHPYLYKQLLIKLADLEIDKVIVDVPMSMP